MTNADKIRAMTDEELMKEFAFYTDCRACRARIGHEDVECSLDVTGSALKCYLLWLEWLRKEV